MENEISKMAAFSTSELLFFFLGHSEGDFLRRLALGSFLNRSRLIRPQFEYDKCFQPLELGKTDNFWPF